MTLEENVLVIFGLGLSGYFMIYGWYWYIRSLKFYYRRNWDLTEDFGPTIYKADPGDEDNEASRSSNSWCSYRCLLCWAQSFSWA